VKHRSVESIFRDGSLTAVFKTHKSIAYAANLVLTVRETAGSYSLFGVSTKRQIFIKTLIKTYRRIEGWKREALWEMLRLDTTALVERTNTTLPPQRHSPPVSSAGSSITGMLQFPAYQTDAVFTVVSDQLMGWSRQCSAADR